MKNFKFLAKKLSYEPGVDTPDAFGVSFDENNNVHLTRSIPVNTEVSLKELTTIDHEQFSHEMTKSIFEKDDSFKGVVFNNLFLTTASEETGVKILLASPTEQTLKDVFFELNDETGCYSGYGLEYVTKMDLSIYLGRDINLNSTFDLIIPATPYIRWSRDSVHVSLAVDLKNSYIKNTEVELNVGTSEGSSKTQVLVDKIVKSMGLKTGPGNRIKTNSDTWYKADDSLFTKNYRDCIFLNTDILVDGFFVCSNVS